MIWRRYGPGLVIGNLFGLWMSFCLGHLSFAEAIGGLVFATTGTVVVLSTIDTIIERRKGEK